jgi:hypothetical protein
MERPASSERERPAREVRELQASSEAEEASCSRGLGNKTVFLRPAEGMRGIRVLKSDEVQRGAARTERSILPLLIY